MVGPKNNIFGQKSINSKETIVFLKYKGSTNLSKIGHDLRK